MSRPDIESYRRDGGLFLTLRVGSGPLDRGFLDALDHALEQADLDSAVTCVMLRIIQSLEVPNPRVPGHFPGDVIADRGRLDGSVQGARRIPKLLVLRVDSSLSGEAIGLLALADIVLATNDIVLRPRSISAALLGMVPVLERTPGAARLSLSSIVECRDLDAHAARHLGLVTDVLPPERLEPVVDSLLRGIANAGPTAVALLKAAVR